jgi:hypothetical protein
MLIDVLVNGQVQKVEARSVPFSVVSENWNEYQTEDGRTVRAKLVLTRVLLPVDGLRNPDGTPVANMNFQPVFVVEEKTSSEKVAEEVCEKFGHEIALLESGAPGEPGALFKVICTVCGMTLEQIRGEKP